MPELPEVETVRRSLEPIVGRRIQSVQVLKRPALRTHTPLTFARALRGATIGGLERRGKNLLIAVDGKALLFRFKLWGEARLRDRLPDPDPETAAVIGFTDGTALEFRALQLSELHLYPYSGEIPPLDHLGPEPFGRGFTWTVFQRGLAGARGPIKNALTEQARFAGIGNLWAHEILHRARIAPNRSVDSLDPAERRAVYEATREVLREAVRQGGEPEFVDAAGRPGRFALAVYGRAGRPCPRDGHAVRKGRLGGRPSFWCPECQR